MEKYANPDAFFDQAKNWGPEMKTLRGALLEQSLEESLKWGKPCYSVEGGNVAIIQPFKDYLALMFFKGALLKDPHGALVMLTGNTQAARQLRYTSLDEVKAGLPILRETLEEAIANEKAGLKVEFKETKEFPMPDELLTKFEEMPALGEAWEALTPGRQRGYLLYFSGAKQASTREARIEKCLPAIFEGKGLNDH